MKVIEYLGRQPRSRLKAIGVALVFVIALVDYLSGRELSFSIFYLIPVCLTACFIGRRAGILMAFFCGGAWLVVELLNSTGYSRPFIPYWNGVVRLGIFLISSALISEIVARKETEKRLRLTQTQLETQVRERTAELERNKLLEKQVAEISEREQRRMGQDLHDGLCQQLVSAAFASAVLREQLAEKNFTEAGAADKISDMLNDALSQARNLARGLYPVRLEVDGLASALEEFAGHIQDATKISCKFSCREPLIIHDLTSGSNLYRIAQEAVMNAFKHAGARNISIELSALGHEVILIVSDDGIGFSSDRKKSSGMGLHIMHYRARMIGATLTIQPGPAGGTRVVCSLKNAATLEGQHVCS